MGELENVINSYLFISWHIWALWLNMTVLFHVSFYVCMYVYIIVTWATSPTRAHNVTCPSRRSFRIANHHRSDRCTRGGSACAGAARYSEIDNVSLHYILRYSINIYLLMLVTWNIFCEWMKNTVCLFSLSFFRAFVYKLLIFFIILYFVHLILCLFWSINDTS